MSLEVSRDSRNSAVVEGSILASKAFVAAELRAGDWWSSWLGSAVVEERSKLASSGSTTWSSWSWYASFWK